MRGILIGAIHKKGTFTDDNGKSIDYDNLVLQVQKPIENKLADDSNSFMVSVTLSPMTASVLGAKEETCLAKMCL